MLMFDIFGSGNFTCVVYQVGVRENCTLARFLLLLVPKSMYFGTHYLTFLLLRSRRKSGTGARKVTKEKAIFFQRLRRKKGSTLLSQFAYHLHGADFLPAINLI